MSGKLNISADEAGQLNRMLKVTDVDSQSFVSTMIRLDRSVETAGKSGNTTTKTMKDFGISITDGNGKLLSMNDQLAQLAKGYENAAKAGNEEAFVTELLGARGAALVPILRDYTEAAEAASKVKTVGIDPQEAHDMSVELKVLQMETTQLGNAFGAALMPVAKELAPRIIDGMQSLIQSIKDNKDAIVDTTNAIIDVGSAAGSALKEGVGPLFDYIIDHKSEIVGAFREIQTELRLIKNHPVMGTLAATIPLFNNTDTIKQYMAEAKAQIDAENAVADAKKQTEKDNNRIAANNKILADAQARDAANANAKIVADSKETLKAKEEIEAAIYHASHTTIENELYDIDDKTRKSITAGTDEKTAWELAELQKAEATKKYYKEVADNREQLSEALLKANGDELDARLMEIEKERKAWIEKTQDEVHATELAEQQKIKAVKDAVTAQYGSEIRAVQDAIKNGKDVGEAYAKAHQESIKNQQAENQAYDYVRKQAGVEMPGDVKTKMVTDGNTVSQLKEIVQKLTYDPSKLQKNASNTVSIGTISVSIPVQNTGNADLDMPKIADQAADIITQKIQMQLGGDDNGY